MFVSTAPFLLDTHTHTSDNNENHNFICEKYKYECLIKHFEPLTSFFVANVRLI